MFSSLFWSTLHYMFRKAYLYRPTSINGHFVIKMWVQNLKFQDQQGLVYKVFIQSRPTKLTWQAIVRMHRMEKDQDVLTRHSGNRKRQLPRFPCTNHFIHCQVRCITDMLLRCGTNKLNNDSDSLISKQSGFQAADLSSIPGSHLWVFLN